MTPSRYLTCDVSEFDLSPPMLSALPRPDSLSRQAYAALRRAIRDGMVIPGHIYSELQLARLLGVSRTPVREALIELAMEGAVDKMPQRGFKLRSISRHELTEVFHLRTLLEDYVVTQMAKGAQADDIAGLRRILERQARTDDRSVFLDIDEEFHLNMAAMAHLDRSRQILIGLRSIIWLSGSAALEASGRTRNVIDEHRAVLDAIEMGDAPGARLAIRHHIAETARAADATINKLPDDQLIRDRSISSK